MEERASLMANGTTGVYAGSITVTASENNGLIIRGPVKADDGTKPSKQFVTFDKDEAIEIVRKMIAALI